MTAGTTAMRKSILGLAGLGWAVSAVRGYSVPIHDTDSLRETCSGMYGGKDAFIELSFDSSSNGQLAVVIYEWKDVEYLGAETPDDTAGGADLPLTYICTSSAVRSGLCSSNQMGTFITSLPPSAPLNSTSIYTTALKFDSSSFPSYGNEESGGGYENEEPSEVYPPADEETGEDSTVGSGEGDESYEDDRPSETVGGDDFKIIGDDGEGTAVDEEKLLEEIEAELEQQESEGDFEKRQFEDEELYGEEEEEEAEYFADEDSSPANFIETSIAPPGFAGEQQEGAAGNRFSANDEFEDSYHPQTIGELENEFHNQEEQEYAQKLQDEYEESTSDDRPGEYLEPVVEEETDETDDGYEVTPTTSAHRTRPTSSKHRPTYGGYDQDDTLSGSDPSSIRTYDGPIMYSVPKTGYYCVGVVPVTVVNGKRQLSSSATTHHAEYKGQIWFRNNFSGDLPAAEYPKLGLYLFLSTVYAAIAIGWAILCFKFVRELLPIQYYISGTIGFLVVEHLANYAYYRYLNKHGAGGASSAAFLLVVAILNAGRNSLSLFLLLITAMGLSIVTPTLGPAMQRARLLTAAHFIFGVLYSTGVVNIDLETAPLLLLLFMVLPLSITLTVFLTWIIVGLHGTITHLSARGQSYKRSIYQRLYRILVIAVLAVAAFFVLTSLSISGRMDENYAAKSWKTRWILTDGSLSLIYLIAFAACAWLFRPTRNNRSFSLSEQLATDDDDMSPMRHDGEDYELRGAHQLGDDEDEEDGPPSYSKANGNNGHGYAKSGYANGGADYADGDENGRFIPGRDSREDEEGRGGDVVFSIDEEDEDDGEIGGKGAQDFKKWKQESGKTD